MRVFVTGATGWVGSAVVKNLIAAGHHVIGLCRSDDKAPALAAAGAAVHRGSIQDMESLKSGVAQSHGVIHLAFNHDYPKFAENGADEKRAIEAIGAALSGSDRPLVVTSGVALLCAGQRRDRRHLAPLALCLLSAQPGGRRRGAGRRRRAGDGREAPALGAWPWRSWLRPRASSLLPARRASPLMSAPASIVGRPCTGATPLASFGSPLSVGLKGVRFTRSPTKACHSRTSRKRSAGDLNVPVVSQSPEEAAEHFGWFARFVGIDCPATSERTRSLLGWKPDRAEPPRRHRPSGLFRTAKSKVETSCAYLSPARPASSVRSSSRI